MSDTKMFSGNCREGKCGREHGFIFRRQFDHQCGGSKSPAIARPSYDPGKYMNSILAAAGFIHFVNFAKSVA